MRAGAAVVELGCWPGSWLQVLAERVGDEGCVVGVDVEEVAPLPGVVFVQGDFTEPEVMDEVERALGRPAQAVLSDAAPKLTGIKDVDRAALGELYEAALALAGRVLAPDGALVVKGFPGPESDAFRRELRARFARVSEVRPKGKRGTHRVVDTPECRIHDPVVNDVAGSLRRAIVTTRTEPYRDGPHRGDLRYLQVVIERASGRAQVVLVGRSSSPRALQPLAQTLSVELGERLHSLWWNGQPARTNAILGPHWRRISGPEAIRERIAGVDVCFPPGAFGQSHPELVERIAAAIHAHVPAGARVVELYAGCGGFGLGLLARGHRVTFSERGEHALRGLALGLAERPPAERERAQVRAGDAAGALELLPGADVVLVDPPRRGLAAPLVDALIARPPERLVYVSCGLDSLVRESERFIASGLALVALEAFALFPYTEHVETLAVFAPAT